VHALKLFTFITLLLTSGCSNFAHADLKLVGSATIKFAGILKICDIQLFSTDTFNWANDEWDKPLKLKIEYHRDIPAERLVQSAEKALAEEFGAPMNQRFESQKQKLHQIYEDVEKGDVYEISYTPNEGMSLLLNSTEVFSADDDSFARYYLRIWLGNNRMAESIERQLKRQV